MAKKRIVDLIVEHSLELYPIEACGILIGEKRGSVKLIQKVYKTRNVFNTPSRYKISPEDQLTAYSEAEKEGKEVLGFYHSHPYWEAKPSTFDISVAFYEGLSYVIYSIPTRSIASYIWEGGNFILEEVKII